jgi:hypothetical protein
MAKNTAILGGAYEVLGLVPGKVGWIGGVVDLSKINTEQAEQLIQEGFPYLKKVEKKAKAEKEDNG